MMIRQKLTCMKRHVILEVGLFAESTIADLAFEWPAPIVDVHVTLEVARCGEALGAECTFVWFFLFYQLIS